MNYQNKIVLTTAVVLAITGSAIAAGINNTVDINASNHGAEAVGKNNTITSTATAAFAAGYNNSVSAPNATVIGTGNYANGKQSLAGGMNSEARGANSIAFGDNAHSNFDDTYAIGSQAVTSNNDTVAIGNYTQANGVSSLAVGYESVADKDYSVAVGISASGNGRLATAIGFNAWANAENATVVGPNASANDTEAVAVGKRAEAYGVGSVAIGNGASTTKASSIAIGDGARSTNSYSMAIGQGSMANGPFSMTIGNNSKSKSDYTIAIGNSVITSLNNSVGIGSTVNANGVSSVAIGHLVSTSGTNAINIGNANEGATKNSVLVGAYNTATHTDHLEDPEGDVLVGNNNILQDGFHGVVLGKDNIVNDANYAVAIGNKASVTKDESVAIGHSSKANTVRGTDSLVVNGDTYDFAGTNPVGTVSIGDTGKERTITNVAAGRVDETSTDAINGSQLNAVINTLKPVTVVGDDERNIRVETVTNNDHGKEYKVILSRTLSDMSAVNLGDHANGTVIERGSVQISNSDDTNHSTTTYFTAGSGMLDNEHASVSINQSINGVPDAINIRSMVDPNTQLAINSDGIVIKGDTDYETKMSFSTVSGIHAGNQQIHDVAKGTAETDAVNVSQLKEVESKINNVGGNIINEAKGYSNESSASAIALAGLKYLDYNPKDKWSFATAYGHYVNKSAMAIGAAYQPNESTMVHAGVTLNNRSAFNIGASFKFGYQDPSLRMSRLDMANQIKDMQKQIDELKALVLKKK